MESVGGESSSSSSWPERSWTYHVFLSFRGSDTRKGFSDHLYAALERKGIKTFGDDKELERGDLISLELGKAIEESMFAVIVLSPNYASSTWCLDELCKILDCNHKLGLEILPVFYGVEPCDVRHHKGIFQEAFRKHEHRFGGHSVRVKGWRDAFTQLASYSGWESKNQHEAKLVESIVEHIHKKMIPKLPSCTENCVGIAPRIEEVIKFMGTGLNDVRFVGLWGMGGIGKTTIARAVYEFIRGEFSGSCFLRNVRELYEANGSVFLQRSLLSYLNVSAGDFHDIEDGKRIIKTSLCKKKVCIVLDDISEEKQLEILAKEDWFGPGSRIIITTRDKHLLNGHGVHGIYEVKGLDQNEATHLFCWKAFKQLKPKEGYSDLSKQVVNFTKGLPLAIQVLGSYLCGRDDDFWHSTINEIKSGLHIKIFKALKISYDHLMPIEKSIFLDIACFFKGEDKNQVVRILKMCESYVGIGSEIGSGIVTLIDKSLVTLDQCGRLQMHDLHQEMGRQIVYDESPTNPDRRSRLWERNDIDQVLANDMGTKAIQGILLPSDQDSLCAQWSIEAFSKITQLKILSVRSVNLSLALNFLPRSLKVLHWSECPLETLPLADQSYELVEIKLQSCNIKQLWHRTKILGKLKDMDLSYSLHLKQTPDLSGAPNLETLVLQDCVSLTEVHPSLTLHKNLVVLNLSWCTSLKTLPAKLEMSSLKELIIDYCRHFENPPQFGECMKKLSRLSMRFTPIRELPISVGCLIGLEDLNIEGCKKLESLPITIQKMKSLKTIDASWCLSLHALPTNICEVPKLRYLTLNYCYNLQLLPKLPTSVREVQACRCDSLDISESNIFSTVCKVSRSLNSQVFQMLIPGSKIPSWFLNQQDGNCVSMPYPSNNERMGIVLCFLLQTFNLPSNFGCVKLNLSVCSGNKVITNWSSPTIYSGYHLYMLCLADNYFNDEFQQHNHFGLLIKDWIPDNNDLDDVHSIVDGAKVLSSAGCWVHIEDIEVLSKTETERPKRKRKRVLDLNKSIEEMGLDE